MKTCKHCNIEMNMMISLTFVMPSSLMGKITKKCFTKKEVNCISASWNNADFICPKCGYTISNRKARDVC